MSSEKRDVCVKCNGGGVVISPYHSEQNDCDIYVLCSCVSDRLISQNTTIDELRDWHKDRTEMIADIENELATATEAKAQAERERGEYQKLTQLIMAWWYSGKPTCWHCDRVDDDFLGDCYSHNCSADIFAALKREIVKYSSFDELREIELLKTICSDAHITAGIDSKDPEFYRKQLRAIYSKLNEVLRAHTKALLAQQAERTGE